MRRKNPGQPHGLSMFLGKRRQCLNLSARYFPHGKADEKAASAAIAQRKKEAGL